MFVPHLAVNGAVLLAVLNVAVLIYFIHHISDSIQVSTLASTVRSDLFDVVDRLYPDDVGKRHQGREDVQGALAQAETNGARVTVDRCGYVQSIRDDALMDTARQHDVLVVLRLRPGQYVLDDTLAALIHPPDRSSDELVRALRSAVKIADARSPHQDPEFAVQQLTEMAVRALSPGTNDPYTALNALDDLSAGLARLAARTPPSPARQDADGVLRVYAPMVAVDELVGSVVDSMRWYAASTPQVMHATLRILGQIGEHAADAELRESMADHLELLVSAFDDAGLHSHDVAALDAHAADVRRALRWGPGRPG